MITQAALMRHRVKVLGLLASHYLGWQGYVGAFLLVAGCSVGAHAVQLLGEPVPPLIAPASQITPIEQADLVPRRLVLPQAADVPALVARLARACGDAGVFWADADYRLSAGSGTTAGGLEVSATLRGSYPQVRQAIGAMLRDTPTLTLGSLAIQRESADTGEIQATLSLIIFLKPSVTAAEASTRSL